jgi:hypothetical protein
VQTPIDLGLKDYWQYMIGSTSIRGQTLAVGGKESLC